jgi:hypothetical protein
MTMEEDSRGGRQIKKERSYKMSEEIIGTVRDREG